MKDILINVSHATSPQAKGRVERANKTLQDRLVKEMRLANISSMDSANNYLQKNDFIVKHNSKFAVSPAIEQDAHRSIDGYNLYNIFCSREIRVVTNDFTVRYKRRALQVEKHQQTIIRPKNLVSICEHLDGKLTMQIRNVTLNFKEIRMRRTSRLSAIEYVNLHKNDTSEKKASIITVYGNLKEDINNRKVESKNRNFSCC